MTTPTSPLLRAAGLALACLGILQTAAEAQGQSGNTYDQRSNSQQQSGQQATSIWFNRSASIQQTSYQRPQAQQLAQPRRSLIRRPASASTAPVQLPAPAMQSMAPPATAAVYATPAARKGGLFSGIGRMLPRRSRQQQEIAPAQPSVTAVHEGIASWYGPDFHGGPTASGEKYNMHSMTAAHRSLPFGTLVRVTNLNNGQNVIVRINNRGPYIKGRIIDLSKGAASQINMVSRGVCKVRMEVLGHERDQANVQVASTTPLGN